ncbi:ImmA/IrrE family metallo-endopeptidase [Rhizobium sp. YIM 134829]|uniref:ImmA/IrrE family metallo-endopeptidase n=1 Tax=Rhizobium sp. YIM 134829 TaxID=3390453 RepID=UPI0039784661
MRMAMTESDLPNYKAAKAEADRLTKIYSAPSIPVIEIAEQNGVNVLFSDLGRFRENIAGFCDFQAARLYVNRDDSTTRQMFTIAHELGHWLLHRDAFLADPERYPVLPRFQKPDENNAFEREANAFAANLLVPDHLLEPVKGAPVSALADVFGVSRTMMEYRLKR